MTFETAQIPIDFAKVATVTDSPFTKRAVSETVPPTPPKIQLPTLEIISIQ